MKRVLAFLIFVLILPVACFSQESQALTLKECYQLALIQSELTKIDTEHIKQAEAHFLQAFGTIMPQVSFSRTHLWETSATASKNSSFEQAFVFKQTLFSGFKEFAGISGGKLEKKQRENEKLRGEQLLFVDVSDAFYLLLEVREDLKTLETIRKAFTDRIDELKTRTDLGKSRQSEVVNTETQLYSLEDQIALVKSQEALARELLEFLIGRRISEIVEPVASFSLKPESEYLAAASRRADVLAADFAWQVDKKNMAITKSGFFPSVNLEGDYFGHRNTVPRDSRWRTQLSIDIPIFEGTTTFGKYKEAVSKARESELLFKRSGRVAENEIQNAYSNAQAALARAALLEKALTSAELNYKLQLEDYQLNVVNNLEVLTAIQDLENIRRNFNHVSYEGKRFYWQLQVAAGEIDLSRL